MAKKITRTKWLRFCLYCTVLSCMKILHVCISICNSSVPYKRKKHSSAYFEYFALVHVQYKYCQNLYSAYCTRTARNSKFDSTVLKLKAIIANSGVSTFVGHCKLLGQNSLNWVTCYKTFPDFFYIKCKNSKRQIGKMPKKKYVYFDANSENIFFISRKDILCVILWYEIACVFSISQWSVNYLLDSLIFTGLTCHGGVILDNCAQDN